MIRAEALLDERDGLLQLGFGFGVTLGHGVGLSEVVADIAGAEIEPFSRFFMSGSKRSQTWVAGHCTDELRLPRVPMEEAKVEELRATLKKLALI